MKKSILYTFLVIFLMAFLPKEYCFGQPGALDPTFNPDDIGFGNGDGANNDVRTTSIQNDGKIIIGGNFTSYNGTPRIRIARLNLDGTLDTSFNSGTGVNGTVWTTSIQSDGKIIIGGDFTSYNETPINRIARLNIDGTLDATFNPGLGANNLVRSTSIQSDGKIIIGGNFTFYNGTSINKIARINTDGTLDTSFNIGTGTNDNILTLSIQADGKIIVGGQFTSYNGTPANRIVRLNPDGTLDASFDSETGANNTVNTITIQSDGKVIIGGWFTSYNNTPKNRITRLNIDGTLDTSFNSGTGVSGFYVYSSSIQSDGKIIIVGGFSSYNGTTTNSIARINIDGTLDTSFNPAGIGASNPIYSTVIQSDGKIFIGGGFEFYNESPIRRFARLNPNGTIDVTFNPVTGANGKVVSTYIQDDGKIIIGGIFNSYNGTPITRIARLNSDGTLDTSFNPGTGASGTVNTISIQSDGKIIIGGNFISYNGIAINTIARLNSDGTLDTSFNPGTGASTTVNKIAIQSDGKIIVGGQFTFFNGVIKNNILRLNPNGTIDASFNTGNGTNAFIASIQIQNDGKILIGGGFTSYNGTVINRIAQLNPDGTLDSSFNPGTGANESVRSISIQSDGKIIIGGNFISFNGTNINRIARLNTDGTLDTSFNPSTGANYWVWSTAIQSDGKIIIGGNFTSYNGVAINRITRLNPDGTLDLSFYNIEETGANDWVETISIQSDGKIIIGGGFTSYNGIGRNRIARLNGGDSPIPGKLFLDLNENCIQENNEILLNKNFIVSIQPGDYTVQAQNGFWYLDSLPAGNYTATIDTTTTNWTLTCPATQTFTVVHPDSITIAPSFGFVSNFPCPVPNVSIVMPRMRRGFGNQKIYIEACNQNTATDTLANAYVDVQLDENISVQSASLPYIDFGVNLFRVDVGTLYPGDCVNFYFTTTVELSAVANQTLCLEAELFPQPDCVFDSVPTPFLPPNSIVSPCNLPWDRSSVQVTGNCDGDSIRFVVPNTGSAINGNMQCYLPVRLYIDGELVYVDSIMINGGEFVEYVFAGSGQTFRLEVDQHPLHPGNSKPNASVENCGSGNWTPGIIGTMPQDDADPIIDIFCGQVSAPYDPNDKTGFPLGVGEINKIRTNQSIEYLIRFQNIGTDTAVNVVIQDTLSEDFNIFTVVSGVSSHPYEFSIKGQRLLEWRFNNIMLPDSTTDEPGSNGFVTFKVNQVPDLPLGTVLENTAYIYFDFEEAVITNTYTHTIGEFNLLETCYGGYELVDTSIIACDSAVINGNTYYTSQMVVDTIPNQFFCGKIQTSNLVINQKVIQTETITTCDSAEVNGTWYFTSQEVSNTYLTQDSCLEVITNLVINKSITQNETITACDSVEFNGTWYFTSQEVSNTYQTSQNCDSVVVTNLVINSSAIQNEILTACDSIEFNGTWYYTSQEVSNTYQTSEGCDSVVITNLVINSSVIQNEDITACDSSEINGTWYYTSQEVSTTYQTTESCDSVVITNLVINSSVIQNETLTACDSIEFNGTWYYTSQEVSNTYQTSEGCDSVVITNLVINSSVIQNETITSCDSDSIEFNGTWYYTSQEVSTTYQTSEGCDSVVITNLVINSSVIQNEDVTACDSSEINGTWYYTSQEVSNTYQTTEGCDSVVITNLVINSSVIQNEDITACDSAEINGIWYYTSQEVSTTYQTTEGCDSVVNVMINIEIPEVNIVQIENNLQVASGFSLYEWSFENTVIEGANSNTLQPNFDGEYTVQVTDGNGCIEVATFNYVRTSLYSNSIQEYIEIYPNPSQGIFTIELFNDIQQFNISVFDISGRVIKTRKIESSNYELDLSDQANGIYFISISTEKGNYVNKLIKNQ